MKFNIVMQKCNGGVKRLACKSKLQFFLCSRKTMPLTEMVNKYFQHLWQFGTRCTMRQALLRSRLYFPNIFLFAHQSCKWPAAIKLDQLKPSMNFNTAAALNMFTLTNFTPQPRHRLVNFRWSKQMSLPLSNHHTGHLYLVT